MSSCVEGAESHCPTLQSAEGGVGQEIHSADGIGGSLALPLLEELGFRRVDSQEEEDEQPEEVHSNSWGHSSSQSSHQPSKAKAKRLASILSRLHFAAEDDAATPSSLRPPPRADNWKSSIEAHAQKVRNKLGLRAQCVLMCQELGYPWDLIEVIRSRSNRNYPVPRNNMWDVRVSEIYNDLMWRKRLSLIYPLSADKNSGEGQQPLSSASSPELVEPSTPPPERSSEDWWGANAKGPALLTPSAQKHGGGLQSRSSELLEKLHSRHFTDSSLSGDEMIPAYPKFSRKSVGNHSRNQSVVELPNVDHGHLAPPVPLIDSRHTSSGSIGAISSESTGLERFSQLESGSHKSISSPSAPVDLDLTQYSCFKPPQESNCNNIEASELEYMCTVLKEVVRRTQFICEYVESNVEPPTCDVYRIQVKRDIVPKYLDYLACMEKSTVDKRGQVDQDIVSALDSLMVSSDMMSSEVNTTLNRQLRETTAELDRLCASHQQCLWLNFSFCILEYFMVGVMWIYWAVAVTILKVARGFTACFGLASWVCLF